MLSKDFFTKNSLIVAKALLGKKLCFKDKECFIVETEAYTVNDPGSHAFKGRTKRNELMFHQGGCLYVYLCYGIHELMNIVTDKEGVPSAVLIRAVEPVNFSERTNGPGLVTKALGVNREHNGCSVISKELHFKQGLKPKSIIQTSRIGLRKGSELPYRFYIKGNDYVSKK